MKFYAPGDEPVMIALTSGHTAVVQPAPTGTDLDPRFHREAAGKGCRLEGSAGPEGFDSVAVFDRRKVIRAVIEAMLDGTVADDFTNDGVPALKKVQEGAGFAVSREERDAVWAEVVRDVAEKP